MKIRSLPRILAAFLFALAFFSPALAAPAHHKPHKKHISRHWHGYGFLPGYRSPEQIARDDARRRHAHPPLWYGPAYPQFYHGRWNGGGFGPCYTHTPIGYVWNCGR